jgi:mannosyltransferase
MRPLKNWIIPLLVVVLLLAAAARIGGISRQSLWNDEGNSYVQATRSFAEISVNAAADIHPPGYYWFLKVWRNLGGDSELALRYPSALVGVLTVALVYGVAARMHPSRRWMGDIAGMFAALLTALNTFSITYGQEARMYAALALWAVAGIWALVGFFNHPTLRRGAVLAIVNALGLWTHYAYPLVMLAQLAVALVWFGRLLQRRGAAMAMRGLWRYLVVNVFGLLLFVPLLPTAIRQVTTWPNTGDATVTTAEALAALLRVYAFGITALEVDVSWLAIALILVLFSLHTDGADAYWRSLAPLALFAVPTAIFLALGLYREGNMKFLLPAQAGFALALGQGISVLVHFVDLAMMRPTHDLTTLRATRAYRFRDSNKRRRNRRLTRAVAAVAAVGLLVTVVRALPALYTDSAYARDDYRAISQRIAAGNSDDYAVILNAPGQIEVFSYYFDGKAAVLTIPGGINSTPDEIRTSTASALAEWRQLYLVLWGDEERDPEGVVEQTLDAQAYEVESRWYGDVRLVHYVTEPTWFNEQLYPRQQFGEVIRLQEVQLERRNVAPGEPLLVRLEWEAEAAPTADYRVFLQLLDENGALVVGRDAVPVAWSRPTSGWSMGEQITDRHALLIPADTPPSNLTLIAGLYNPAQNGKRLPVVGQPDTYLEISNITVSEG